MDCKNWQFRKAFIYLLILISGATGVRNLEMIVPAMVRSGDSARLSCHYVLEGAPLYTVQWYLGDQEFYRYVPKKSPPQLNYPVQGIDIDVKNSNMNDVTLRNVSREVAGMYKCEVSEDAPTYHTIAHEQLMQIADIPETDPVIQVERQRLPAGETLRANCTSGTSHPAPNVTWTLNGDHLNDTTMQYRTWTRQVTQGKMELTWSNLELKVFGEMFYDGRLQLRCFASISGVYTAIAEVEINEDRPLIASITGDASPHSHRSSGVGHKELTSLVSSTGLVRAGIMASSMLMSIANLR